MKTTAFIVGGLAAAAVVVFLFLRMRKAEKSEAPISERFVETPRAPPLPSREQGGITAGATIGTPDITKQISTQLRDAGASVAEMTLGV